MAHAAKIENGTVTQVIVIPDGLGGDENDSAIQAYINGIGLSGVWKRTSYNATNGFRNKYAGVGDKWIEDPSHKDGGYFESPILEINQV